MQTRGVPNSPFQGHIPHIALPPEHSAGRNEGTMAPTPENPPSWRNRQRPREVSERMGWPDQRKRPQVTSHTIRDSACESCWTPESLQELCWLCVGHTNTPHRIATDLEADSSESHRTHCRAVTHKRAVIPFRSGSPASRLPPHDMSYAPMLCPCPWPIGNLETWKGVVGKRAQLTGQSISFHELCTEGAVNCFCALKMVGF